MLTSPTLPPPDRKAVAFGSLPVGARFRFRRRRYVKLALSLAEDIWQHANIFPSHTEVQVTNLNIDS